MGTYSIGYVAKIFDISPQSIRNFEAQKLTPSPRRTPTGARRYTDTDVEAIRAFMKKKYSVK